MKKLAVYLFVVALAFSVAGNAWATPISVDPAYWDASRSTDSNGLTGTGRWEGINDNGFRIAWEISETEGMYSYNYTITGSNGISSLSQDLSHWILEVTDSSNINEFTFTYSPEIKALEGPDTFIADSSNPNMLDSIYGIKWEYNDVPTLTLSFDTFKDPVWGDFYAKDGDDSGDWTTAWNIGFGTYPTTVDAPFTNWIARPNGGAPVPEPATMLLLGTGLIGLAGIGRKKIKKARSPA